MKRHIIACDLGGTKIEVGCLDLSGNLIQNRVESVSKTDSLDVLVRQIADSIQRFDLEDAIPWIGIAAPGPIQPDLGLWRSPTNFQIKGQLSLKDAFERAFPKHDFQFVFENDAAAALIGEQWKGSLKESRDAAMLTLGTGLGVGISIDGHILRAGRGYHPEPGHWIVDLEHASHLSSAVGATHSAESYLSGNGFAERISQKTGSKLSAKELVENFAAGTLPELASDFEVYGKLLARYLFSLSTCFMPDTIVLGGSFSKASSYFLKTTREELRIFFKNRGMIEECPEVHVSALSNAGLIGAAKRALDRFQF